MSRTRAPADFRSDTVTRPTAAMLDAMGRAAVGDDVYGEDPTVAELERRVARILGKEAALFVPSGTMANQLAVHLQTSPGDSVIAEAESHVAFFEAGGAAALSGVQFDFVPRAERLADDAIRARLRPETIHHATTSLLVLENTHTMGVGRILTAGEVARIVKTAKEHGLAVHCDGARLWNAAAALGVAEAAMVEDVDTVSVCFSKGLGAPVGSALAGPARLIGRARKVRKRWGGAMRQAGYLAAGALYALDHHRSRLADDHLRARALAEALAAHLRGGAGDVDYPVPGTNMVFFRTASRAHDDVVRGLAALGVLVGHAGNGWLRAVTHLDVGDGDVEAALRAIDAVLS